MQVDDPSLAEVSAISKSEAKETSGSKSEARGETTSNSLSTFHLRAFRSGQIDVFWYLLCWQAELVNGGHDD
jgi:hypothetical protein